VASALAVDARWRASPALRERLLFHEYFHGETGAGLGASHQTGWTALIANLIDEIHRPGRDMGHVVRTPPRGTALRSDRG
jgi:hypothetical protein